MSSATTPPGLRAEGRRDDRVILAKLIIYGIAVAGGVGCWGLRHVFEPELIWLLAAMAWYGLWFTLVKSAGWD